MIWWKIFFHAGGKAHWHSLKEILFVLLISTSPLSLGALLNHYADGTPTYLLSLQSVVQRGELFLYCMSVVATVAWLANKEWLSDIGPSSSGRGGEMTVNGDKIQGHEQSRTSQPKLSAPKWLFSLLSLFIFGICTMFFGIEAVRVRIDSASLISFSSAVYSLSIVLWYIINVLSTVDPPNIEQSFDDGARSLARRVRQMRSGNGS